MRFFFFLSLSLILSGSCIKKKRLDIEYFPYTSSNIENLTQITFQEQEHDFGEVLSDTVLRVKYNFKNIGDDTLFILHILPDCNCTDYSISDDTLLVGENGYIELTMNTNGKSGETNSQTRIEVNTKDRFYHLFMTANILKNNNFLK